MQIRCGLHVEREEGAAVNVSYTERVGCLCDGGVARGGEVMEEGTDDPERPGHSGFVDQEGSMDVEQSPSMGADGTIRATRALAVL